MSLVISPKLYAICGLLFPVLLFSPLLAFWGFKMGADVPFKWRTFPSLIVLGPYLLFAPYFYAKHIRYFQTENDLDMFMRKLPLHHTFAYSSILCFAECVIALIEGRVDTTLSGLFIAVVSMPFTLVAGYGCVGLFRSLPIRPRSTATI